MNLENKIKQKILALLTVIVLFIIVGILFFLISWNNKEVTNNLKAKVLSIKTAKEDILRLNRIQIATSTPIIESLSFLTLGVTESGGNKILMQKNPDWALPIASITKLMTALVTLENVSSETEIKATTDYIGREESAFILETDKIYKVKDLVANMLISSDNDSARLLSSALGEANFIAKMNMKASELGLDKTNFVNVTGLDPQPPKVGVNISSPNNLAKLILYIKAHYPKILSLSAEPEYNFCDIQKYCKIVVNTDKLLSNKDFKFKILGGKTGSTDLAGKNLILLMNIEPKIYLINIVLNAKDNFAETTSLINNVTVVN